nr:MAG TPA: tail-collar fiber protein [Caudoviricetes sp.]
MAYRGLTTVGANYLATRLAQELAVEFTKVQIGAGTPTGNPADVTELKDYKLDAKILKKSQENNTVEITIQVVNDNVEQGFYLKEIGVFVNDDTEKLYWYCNEDNAQYIPAKTDSAIAFEIDIKMEVTNIESPILNWSGQGTWVNKEFLEEQLIKKQDETDSRLLTKAKKIWEAINELFNDKQNKTDNNLLTTVKTVIGAINELFNNKLDKGGYNGNAKNLNDEIAKKASTSQLGRMMVGTGLIADSSGRVSIEENSSRRPVSDAEKAAWNGKLTQGTVPNSLNSAEKIVAALKGNGGLKFDESLLYLNDAGTKKVGFMYLDKLTDGIFECTTQTTTTVNNSSYFKNISNKNNSDRLNNLSRISEAIYINFNSEELTRDVSYQYNNGSCNASDGTLFIILFKHKLHSDFIQHILLKETRQHSIQVLGFSSNTMQLDLNDSSFRFFEGSIPENFILYKIFKIIN